MNDEQIDAGREQSSRILEKETLGSFLRKTRIGNGVDLTRMSQKTRIHADLITAIEKDEYDKLPGTTYNKLFIKSIAKYLELNPEEIYKRYLSEHPDFPVTDIPTSTSIPQYVEEKPAKSDTRTNIPEAPTKSSLKTFLPIALLVAAGALILMFMPTEKKETAEEVKQAEDAMAITADTLSDTLLDEAAFAPLDSAADSLTKTSPAATTEENMAPDSVIKKDTFEVSTAAPTPPAQEPEIKLPTVSKRYVDETAGTVQADFICTKGNISISAYRNGNLWTNYFSAGHAKKFSSNSKLYIRMLGTGEGVIVHNNKVIPVKPERNRFVLKVDKDTTEWVTISVWNGVVKKP
jgi:cytoskeletal protein RodZ